MAIPRDSNGRVQLNAVNTVIHQTALLRRRWPSPAVKEAAADSLAVALHAGDVRTDDQALRYLDSWLSARDSNAQRHANLQHVIDEQMEGYSAAEEA